MHKCVNNSIANVYHLEQLVGDFFPYSEQKLGFDQDVTIVFQSDEDNSMRALGRTAHYSPETYEIVLYVDGRHPKDVMRSLSHELVHHAQNCRGDFEKSSSTQMGYAQKDPHLRKMEREAYTKGNLIFRDYEDLIKTGKKEVNIDFSKSGEPKMSLKEWKNDELNSLLKQKWGLLREAAQVETEEPLEEDSGEEEKRHYKKNVGADEKHVQALERDIEYDKEHEELEEGGGWSYRKDDKLAWGKDPAAFTGTRSGEEEDIEAIKKGDAVEEASAPAPGGVEARHLGDDPDTYVGPALGHGMAGNKKVGDPPPPGKRIEDPRHLSKTTTKVPAVSVRESASRKISVREAREITRRIIERIKKESN